MSNVITFPGRNPTPLGNPSFAGRHLPPENIRPVEFRVSGRQKAGRARNILRHPCNRVSLAVTIAGRIQRGEEIGCWGADPVDELRKGAAAAREVARALDIIADEFAREAQQ
ncbi:hypothetical protein GCM10010987_26220 [Bradyrhizobium guangdongense]|uniref:Uncharacterized protein n=1 Tax=Bradyrhizobium guangdongense TaxID=1325090 RepID=A0AA87W5X9_9BRAD|nr:hypothetical protein GCM10010987_26220 [Bradyrhizobium guangdongense]